MNGHHSSNGEPHSRPIVFVVGTGRCGSTILQHVLNKHPDIGVAGELFTAIDRRGSRLDFTELISGKEFFARCISPHPTQTFLIKNRLEPEEFVYRFNRSNSLSRSEHFPSILGMSVPATFPASPEDALDRIGEIFANLPARPVAQHVATLVHLLDRQKLVSVERSGSSLHLVERLAVAYPDAKFVHISRNGAECALSMSRHSWFKIEMLRIHVMRTHNFDIFDSYIATDLRHSAEKQYPGVLPWNFDTTQFEADFPITLGDFEAAWSAMMARGGRSLLSLRTHHVHNVRYEQILKSPGEELKRIAAFLGVDAPDDWIGAAASMVRPNRRTVANEPTANCHAGEAIREELDRHFQ